MNQFKGVEGVSEIYSNDGYYRYVHGNFSSFSKAKAELIRMQDSGFTNAFIRDLNSITDK
jgi:cell division protein FtsN